MTAIAQEILTGEIRCLLCARTAASARVLNGNVHVTLTRPEYADYVRRLRCPACGGNLQIVDTRYERILHFYLTPADLQPRRGRPAKAVR